MKLTNILAVASAIVGLADAQITLAQKWNISEDVSFEYESLSFELGYTVSNFISNNGGGNMARFNLYDEGCKEDGAEVAASGAGIKSIIPTTTDLNTAAGDGGTMNRAVSVNITLDEETISGNSLLYSEDTSTSQVTAEIRFCVRFGLHTKSATSVEVNFLETLVTLNVDLTDGFEIGSIAVEPRDRLVRTANQVYLVVGYRCDASNNQVNDNTPINQGTVVKVCVKPDAEAEADGIHMRSIDDFTWSRQNGLNTVNQPAIIGRNQVAANQLTSLDCTPGDEVCTFETILFAAFYTTPGAVLGSGVASMQFGSTNRGIGRRLRSGAADERELQEEDAVAAAEFELDFDVAQATAQGTSSAATMSLVAMSFMVGLMSSSFAILM